MNNNTYPTNNNEVIDEIPCSMPDLDANYMPTQVLNEQNIAADISRIMDGRDVSGKTEEEKNHLNALAHQMANIDEAEATICAKIMADKYPDIMFTNLMAQMHDLMDSRDEINKSLNIYFGKRNEVFNK